jgi:predicted dinucleotide-binding enzyme
MSQANIAVIGTGDVGATLIELLVAAGRRVVVGSRRAADDLDGAVALLASSGQVEVRPIERSAEGVDVLFLAVPWHAAVTTLEAARVPDGTIVVDTTNFNAARDGTDLDPGPGGTTDVLAPRFPQLRWVKSFNMLWTGFLREDVDRAKPHRVVFVAADEQAAKDEVAALVTEMGFVPFDNGTLAGARERQLEGTPAWNQRLSVDEAQDLLA